MDSFRNPLSTGFGVYLRKERKNRGISTEKMAEKIGLTKSFYTLVENGTNYFHVKNAPAIVLSLNKSICLQKLTGLLMAISHMESSARDFKTGYKIGLKKRYIDGLKASMDTLSSLDAKDIGTLMDLFRNDDLLLRIANANAKEAAKIIIDHGIDEDIAEYLDANNSSGLQRAHGSNVSRKINEIPSMYFEFMSDLIDRLISLPIQIGFHEMWRWEDDQRTNFKEWFCVIKDSNGIVSKNNLERYHFNYLWEHSFKQIRIISLDGKDQNYLKQKFESLMKERLKESIEGSCAQEHIIENAREKLSNFHWAMAKLSFVSLLETSENAELSKLINRLVPTGYSSVWIFTMKSGNNIGFQTKISGSHDEKKNMLIEGISLNHFETDSRLKIMNTIWKENSPNRELTLVERG